MKSESYYIGFQTAPIISEARFDALLYVVCAAGVVKIWKSASAEWNSQKQSRVFIILKSLHAQSEVVGIKGRVDWIPWVDGSVLPAESEHCSRESTYRYAPRLSNEYLWSNYVCFDTWSLLGRVGGKTLWKRFESKSSRLLDYCYPFKPCWLIW